MNEHGSSARTSTERSGNELTREEKHQRLAMLLGAYADRELPLETSSQIDAHLLGCARCRNELSSHQALSRRLEAVPVVRASSALHDRIVNALANAPTPSVQPQETRSRWRSMVPWLASAFQKQVVLALSIVAIVLLVWSAGPFTRTRGPTPGTAVATVVPVQSVALFAAVLADYARVTALDLPGRARDLAAVRAAMPFPVQPLTSDELRLLAAWTTTLDGEPTAVLAYRWNDQLLLHYVVSEQQLFRPSEVRRAFAEGHPMGARDARRSVLAWPAKESGAVLVGDASPTQLAVLSGATAAR